MRISCLRIAVLPLFAGLIFAGSLATPLTAAEPVSITAIDAKSGMVSAREIATKRTFQFQVNDAALLKSLKVGQVVQADFKTQKVSVDGIQPCCNIVNVKP